MAAFEKHVGTFTSPTSADSSYGITGVGFTPKIVIFIATHRIDDDADGTTDASHSIGAMTSTDQWCIGFGIADASANASNDYTNTDNRCIVVMDGSATSVEEAAFVSMDSDGFTLNYSKANGAAFDVHYMALGGVHLNVDVGMMNVPTTSPPNTVNSPSLGFAPVGYLLAVNGQVTTNQIATGGDNIFAMGGASSATEEFTCAVFDEDGVARTDTGSDHETNRVLVQQTTDTGLDWESEHSALGSDTFTINVVTAAPASTTRIGYVAFGGSIDCFIGNFASTTASSSQSVTIETDFQPDAMMSFGNGKTSSGASRDGGVYTGISAGAPISSAVHGYRNDDNNANSEPSTWNQEIDVSNGIVLFSHFGTAFGAKGSVAFTANGFDVTWSFTPAEAGINGYFAIKDVPGALLDMPSRRRNRSLLAR